MSAEASAPAENRMGVAPVPGLLFKMALPMMISMLIQALYNFVDSVFVSRISEEALTAVSMAFPMQNLMIGVATGLAVGTNALLSRSLGEKKYKRANDMALHGIMLSVCGYLLFLVLGLSISRWYYVVQGASEEITEYGVEYISIVMCVSFGLFLEMMFERLLQATGRTIYTMFTQGLGAVLNIIFDPIFIFGLLGAPKMGIRGAAFATVLGQIVAASLALLFNILINHDIHLNFRGFRPNLKVIENILYIALPSVVMIGIGSVMTFCVNRILIGFSSTAVAVFGVYYKMQNFAFMPVFGLNNGMVPIVSYNYGAGKPDRMMQTVKFAVLYAAVIMVTAFAIIQIFPTQLLLLFDASAEMMDLGIRALRIISISFLMAPVSVVLSSFYQALGNGVYSMLVSFFRQLIFLVPLVFIISRIWGVQSVWYAWPIAEVASITCCLFFLNRIYKKIVTPMRKRVENPVKNDA